MDFQDLWAKNGELKGKIREGGGAILTPNELVLTFEGLHLCVKFGENRQRNATVRVMHTAIAVSYTHLTLPTNREV